MLKGLIDLKNLEEGYLHICEAFPKYAVSKLHGKMKPAEKDVEMQRFVTGETQIMVATTVIEVGVNVPNASVMVIENAERLIGIKVKGRMDGTLSRDGELNPDNVAKAIGKENKSAFTIPSVVEMRPPALCEGCGHRDMYTTLTEVLKENYPTHKVFSDIGCYTLTRLSSPPDRNWPLTPGRHFSPAALCLMPLAN